MYGLEIVDLVVIGIYSIVLMVIGIRAMRQIHSPEDFFLGGRRFGKIVQIFTAFGQATSSQTAAGTVTTTFQSGASGIWSVMMVLWATPLYWLTSPWYRRMRVMTLGDFFRERYDSHLMAGIYSLVTVVYITSIIGIGLKAVSATIEGMTPKEQTELTDLELREYQAAIDLDRLHQLETEETITKSEMLTLRELELRSPRKIFSHFDSFWIIVFVCCIVFVYAIAGGLTAAVYTDVMQGCFILLLSILLIPFAILKINNSFGSEGVLGAWGTVHQRLPEQYFDLFGSTTSIDFTWYYIVAISILVAINVTPDAYNLNAIGSAKDELTARIGFTVGNFIKRFCTILWAITGLLALALYSGVVDNPDYVWGHATRDLLGGLGIGLVGLMMACLFAALMSTADMSMVVASGVLTCNVYRPLFPHFSEMHYVFVGRILGGIVLIGGAFVATYFDSILQLMKHAWEINSIVAAAFLCGLKWRRANRQGAWASIAVAFLLFGIVPVFAPIFLPSMRGNQHLLKRTNPQPITHTYHAREIDVLATEQKAREWDVLNSQGKAKSARPHEINFGELITLTFQPKRKSIFWSKGIKIDENGSQIGEGLFHMDLYLINKCFDITHNSYALNETIRVMLRIAIPFMTLVLVALITRSDDIERLGRFYVKMRTPVLLSRDEDNREMEKSYANLDRFKEDLAFPNSNFELFKWNKIDTIGFSLSVMTVFAILALLYVILHMV